jgi:hypothetical protein
MTQKIVINACHGGFGLSDAAIELYGKLSHQNLVRGPDSLFGKSSWYVDAIAESNYFYDGQIPRDCRYLVEVVEKLGESANSRYSELKVVTIPDDVEWHIAEYDGWEHVAENHRTWS